MANIIGRIQADGSIVWDGGTAEAKSQNGVASEFDIVNTTDKE